MFPALYHTHHSLHLEDIPFWQDLAKQTPDPILELGCGSGRVLLPLAQSGHQLIGLDNDLAMLRFFIGRILPSERENIHLFQADMAHFHLEVKPGLILLPCNTLSTLSRSDLRAMLACVINHLQEEGVFAASFPNPARLAAMPKRSDAEVEEIFNHPEDDEPVQVSSAWERTSDRFEIRWSYDHLFPDGRVERTQAVVKHQLWPIETYLEEFSKAGFQSIRLFGDFDYSPYRKSSPYCVVLAAKQPS